MSQMPGAFTSDVPEGPVDNKLKERKNLKDNSDDKGYVSMQGSTSIGIPNPTGAALFDTNPSPPNPWENKSPFEVNADTGPWDGVKNDKPEDGGPVIVDNSLPANVAAQPQHHQQIREGREAVKEPADDVADDVTDETRSSPEQGHSQKRNQEIAALAAITGQPRPYNEEEKAGWSSAERSQPRPYGEEENAGRSLAERSHGDRLARHEQPQHGREQERQHEKEREHQHEKELEREKEREQKRRREEERERQNAQQFKQRQLPSEQARDGHDRAHRVTTESESSNEELYHDSPEEHPADHNQGRLARKKSKASATMTKAMGSLKEKVGKLVHHEKTADKGTEQKMVGDTKKKLANVNNS